MARFRPVIYPECKALFSLRHKPGGVQSSNSIHINSTVAEHCSIPTESLILPAGKMVQRLYIGRPLELRSVPVSFSHLAQQVITDLPDVCRKHESEGTWPSLSPSVRVGAPIDARP